jgi:hypothetical protein
MDTDSDEERNIDEILNHRYFRGILYYLVTFTSSSASEWISSSVVKEEVKINDYKLRNGIT